MNSSSVGAPEAVLLLTLGLFWIIPLVAFGWALFTLHRIRQAQAAMMQRLETIERFVRNAP